MAETEKGERECVHVGISKEPRMDGRRRLNLGNPLRHFLQLYNMYYRNFMTLGQHRSIQDWNFTLELAFVKPNSLV